MTKEEAVKTLKEIQQYNDAETAHLEADDVLTQFLQELGYYDVVEEYDKIDKWYA